MTILVVILIFAALFAIYDLVRSTNKNILKQTEELKKLNEHLSKFMEK